MDKNSPKYAGIVLAGGKSSRMGQNKALMSYKGKPMLAHMINILRECDVYDIFISGYVDGFDCIPDTTPFCGPVQAICNILQQTEEYNGYVFVPVDMPLLTTEALRILMSHPQGAYFTGCPLPFFLTEWINKENFYSVRQFLDANQVTAISLPPIMGEILVNTNTPEEWEKVLESQ